MMQYTTAAEVKERVLGKVKFTDNSEDENAVSSGFLIQIIDEAESEVELRLSVRYDVPFQGDNEEAFTTLPTTTQVQIKTLCRMEAVRRILNYDFGRGSAIESDGYYKGIHQDYETRLERLISLRDGT